MREPRRPYRHHPAALLGGVVALVLALTGCSSSSTSTEETGSGTFTPVSAAESSRPSDDSITAWVQEAFREDPRIASSDIEVRTDAGVVTLRGTTANLLERRYARLETQKISGVRGIIDELTVAPSSRSDMEINKDVMTRLTGMPRPPVNDLEVSVTDGTVTLSGDTTSWAFREQAESLASQVRGVRSVTNDLVVDYNAVESDEQRRTDVVSALDRDPYLTGCPIAVTVDDGVAELEGSVGNAYEKERAETDAYLASTIRHVDNNLFVDWFAEKGVREASPWPTDTELRRAVRDELELDVRLADPSTITVEIADRQATLLGSVPTYYEKLIAKDDAANVVGVLGVTDLLTITAEPRSDEGVANAVRIELDVDYALNGPDIGVDVDEGIVTLTGQVDSYFQRRHAERVASRVAGVHGVVNEILVNRQPGFTDAAIQERIVRRLVSNWKTRPVSGDIDVRVNNGIAVLSGEVDTWSQRMEAERLARLTEGVTEVKDDLAVEFESLS